MFNRLSCYRAGLSDRHNNHIPQKRETFMFLFWFFCCLADNVGSDFSGVEWVSYKAFASRLLMKFSVQAIFIMMIFIILLFI